MVGKPAVGFQVEVLAVTPAEETRVENIRNIFNLAILDNINGNVKSIPNLSV